MCHFVGAWSRPCACAHEFMATSGFCAMNKKKRLKRVQAVFTALIKNDKIFFTIMSSLELLKWGYFYPSISRKEGECKWSMYKVTKENSLSQVFSPTPATWSLSNYTYFLGYGKRKLTAKSFSLKLQNCFCWVLTSHTITIIHAVVRTVQCWLDLFCSDYTNLAFPWTFLVHVHVTCFSSGRYY